MRTLAVSIGRDRNTSALSLKTVTWAALKKKLSSPVRGTETHAHYLSLSREEQTVLKDVGYYVLGAFKNNLRRREEFLGRCAVVLDIDHATPDYEAELREKFGALETFVHTTRKHAPEKPRLRVIFPTTRDLNEIEFQALSRLLASWYGIERVDPVSFRSAQMVFFASVSADAEFKVLEWEGAWLDPDKLLAQHYLDYLDKDEWPRIAADDHGGFLKKLGDPRQKNGIIGAFCRAFDIEAVMDRFIPGVYIESPNEPGRYTYFKSEGATGAVIYDDGQILYSNHTGNDPAANGHGHNAFDLVRIHRFGEMDKGVDKSVPITERPSYKAMTDFAAQQSEVIDELSGGIEDAFEAIEGDDDADAPAPAKAEKPVSKADRRAELRAAIENASSVDELNEKLLGQIALAVLSPIDRADLLNRFDARFKALSGTVIGKRVLNQAVKEIQAAARTTKAESEEGEQIDLEIALARQVIARQFGKGRILRFGKQWWLYSGGVWRASEDDWVRRKVLSTMHKLQTDRDEQFAGLMAILDESGRGDRMTLLVNTIYNMLSSLVAEDGNTDPLNLKAKETGSVINCRNGELWFDDHGNMEFREHNPESRLTSQIDVDYDPSADCPSFRKALDLVFKRCENPDDAIRHWLECMGTLIQPSRPQAFWVLMKGPGGNGKSFLMDIITEMMGSRSCLAMSIAEIALGNNNHFTASLLGKLVLVDDDLKAGTLLPDDWLKKLSEPKLLTANPKGAATFEFTNRATAVILSNHWPSTQDISIGMKRRAQVFELAHVIPQEDQDHTLKRRIVESELSGVLNLLVAGWCRVLARGGRFATPDECVAATERWISAANATERYLNERIAVNPKMPNVPAQRVFEDYKRWVHMSEDNIKPLGRNSFYQILISRGFVFVRQGGTHFIKQIEILPDPIDLEFISLD